MDDSLPDLHISKTHSARVTRLGEDGWRLEIPAGKSHQYRLAQLDDHRTHRRSSFRWQPPLTISLQARVSTEDLPGTWGFGLWNDPFSFLLGYEGVILRLPALPGAAWFFHASAHNYLSFRNDLPANGFLSATFLSARVPPLLVTLGAPLMGLSLIPGAAQAIRWVMCKLVRQDAAQLGGQTTDWHTYRMAWEANQVRFFQDEVECLRTNIAPHPPLSLLIWIDNQYAALPPTGGLKFGYLPNAEPAWLEIRDLRLQEKV